MNRKELISMNRKELMFNIMCYLNFVLEEFCEYQDIRFDCNMNHMKQLKKVSEAYKKFYTKSYADFKPCVYMLLNCGDVIYIGETGNYEKRLRVHLSSVKCDGVILLYPKSGNRHYIEQSLIYKYNPLFNDMHFTSYEHGEHLTVEQMIDKIIEDREQKYRCD